MQLIIIIIKLYSKNAGQCNVFYGKRYYHMLKL